MAERRKKSRRVPKKGSSAKGRHSKKALNSIIAFFAAVLVLLIYLNYEMLRDSGTVNGEIFVHFIDVGQADCILIQSEAGNIIIDGGENATKPAVTEYIKNAGINTFDYAVATHPHSDHIGGLDDIIMNFNVKAIIMPNAVNTTTSFENLLNAISVRELKPLIPSAGDKFYIGGIEFTVISPNSGEYDNLNDYSIGLKMVYGSVSFLFTGDAETLSENEILANGIDISADVFKAGHHGSRTSNSSVFLDRVNPQICVISCGADNEYGHPHNEVLNALSKREIETLRTDELGTIVIKTDGKSIVSNDMDGI